MGNLKGIYEDFLPSRINLENLTEELLNATFSLWRNVSILKMKRFRKIFKIKSRSADLTFVTF